MLAGRPITVTAFVDWNAQIHRANPPRDDLRAIADRTLDHVGRIIGDTLARIDRSARFDVTLRVYHGWHKGFEPSPNRRAIISAIASADFSSISTKANVSIRPNVAYGDQLLSALNRRLHTRLGIHLPNTLRRDARTGDLEEKMVDTAIAADIVDLAHRSPDQWVVVLGDDDDLVPALFTAEAKFYGNPGRVVLMSDRTKGPFLNLDGILEGR